jgi:hypothetical protein
MLAERGGKFDYNSLTKACHWNEALRMDERIWGPLGTADGYPREEDEEMWEDEEELDEDIRILYPWKAVKEYERQIKSFVAWW